MTTLEILVAQASEHVFQRMKAIDARKLVYHNFNHTVGVVDASQAIGKGAGLNEQELHLVALAAWFHDLGYVETYQGHEEVSAQMAEAFLKEHQADKEWIDKVCGAIRATAFPQNPKNRLEEVLCDADLSHLGHPDFLEKSRLLRVEWAQAGIKKVSDRAWIEEEIEFITAQNYHTEYAQRRFSEQKGRHLVTLLALQEDAEEQAKLAKLEKKKRKQKKKKAIAPDRGIETMFRVAFRNHMSLSAIADNKANIMLSINAIIISLTLSTLMPRLYEEPQLVVPVVALLATCLLTIIYATLSTRPKITKGRFTREDITSRSTNLLFFGNFHAMEMAEFEWGMNEMMGDREYLYGSLVKDFYSLGSVLSRKYRYLQWCYLVFLVGMILSVLLFVISAVL